jgi:glycosyltransferase involved in cell wall biosynthesis
LPGRDRREGSSIEAAKQVWNTRRDFSLSVTTNSRLPAFPFLEKAPWVIHECIHRLYESAHFALVPSFWPGPFPIMTVEWLAAGIPEQIRDGETGLLVPPGAAPALASASESLLDDPGKARL